MIPPKNKIRIFEIIAVVLTGIGKFIFIDWLQQKFWYIIVACAFWFVYLLIKYIKDKTILKCWGFTRVNMKETFWILLPIVILGSLTFYIFGYIMGTLVLNWHIFPILLVYPFWGIIQQFLVMGLVAAGLDDMENMTISKVLIVLISTIIFSIVHYPSIPLIIGTFILAIVYSIIYLYKRNLWVLGVSHGIMGCFFYYFVLGRDTWDELFATII